MKDDNTALLSVVTYQCIMQLNNLCHEGSCHKHCFLEEWSYRSMYFADLIDMQSCKEIVRNSPTCSQSFIILTNSVRLALPSGRSFRALLGPCAISSAITRTPLQRPRQRRMQAHNLPYFFRHVSKATINFLLAHPQQRNLRNHLAVSLDHIKDMRLQLFVFFDSPIIYLTTIHSHQHDMYTS